MLPSVGDENPQILQLGSLVAIQYAYRIWRFMKERDWSINTAATAVRAPPIVVAIRSSFRGELYSLIVLSIKFIILSLSNILFVKWDAESCLLTWKYTEYIYVMALYNQGGSYAYAWYSC